MEDNLKTANSKKVKGNGTEPKSILQKGTPIAKKTTAPKTRSTTKQGQKVCDVNNNNTKSDKANPKGKGRKVSFAGKKSATSTKLRK